MPKVLAVIPAFNAEATIASVVQRTLQHVDLVIVIDDGSGDATSRMARGAGAIVRTLPSNRGKGYAFRTGLLLGRSLNPRIVVTLDADAQHLPEQIPRLLEPIEAGEFDVVIGSRFLSGNTGMPFSRVMSNRVSTYLVRLMAGLSSSECTDSQCGFRAFRNVVLERLSNLESERFNIEAETLIAAVRSRLRIREVPIDCVYSDSISSNMKPLREIPAFLKLILREMWKTLSGSENIRQWRYGFGSRGRYIARRNRNRRC